jgi:hypothetical protein
MKAAGIDGSRKPGSIPWAAFEKIIYGYGLASAVFFLVLIFSGLNHSPAPLFQDESDGLSRALHWASSGTTYDGQTFPVLIHWTGQFYSFPAYFYPIAGWSKLFGPTVQSLRAFSAFLGGITAALTYAVAKSFALLGFLLW